MATFSDLRALGYRELDVVVSNSTKRQAEMFSAQTTPNVAVAEAVRMSMSIPLYVEALRFNYSIRIRGVFIISSQLPFDLHHPLG